MQENRLFYLFPDMQTSRYLCSSQKGNVSFWLRLTGWQVHFVCLHPEIPGLLPPRPRHLLRSLLIHLPSERIEIDLSSSLIDINIT